MNRRRHIPSFDGLERRDQPSGVSDPTVPRPPAEPTPMPDPPPEPSPGPFPGSNPPIVFPPPPLGGPVGPA